MANISDIKSTLHKYIVETEDLDVLNDVKDYFRLILSKKGQIVGYTSDGIPLDIKAYKKEIDVARKQIRDGNMIDQDSLEKLSENW